MAQHNRLYCWDVILKYPKRRGNVKVCDIHAHTRNEAKRKALADSQDDIIRERGVLVAVVAHRHPYYHQWFEKLE